MKKEFLIVLIIGVAVVILSSVFKDDKKAKNPDKIENDIKSHQDVKTQTATDDKEDSIRFNSQAKSDEFIYGEAAKSFFDTENFIANDGDRIFLADIMEIDSKFGQDELKRIEELKTSKTKNEIGIIGLEKVVEESDESRKFYVKVPINSVEKRVYFEQNNIDGRFKFTKMIIWDAEGNKEAEVG